ncbi:hypothetical protein INH39_19800 [Massilia violaceinigra]|uniref:Uncharacterized protein n=1 Tax=Massilia violaceinigra TaxID=2045208 RepID=A0ABY3ZZ36_9BURK|nr:hypothetical protein [Massilia violaceinigra]UOD27740.1 hypothetical protein INH39_19800 [Massilia violaceinigra]
MNANFIGKIQEFDASLFASYRSARFHEVEVRLRELLALAGNIDERDHVLDMFVNHFHFVGDLLRARQVLEERIVLSPDLVEARIGLTEHYHYHEEDIEKAAETVEIALQKAFVKNRQVRQVLGVRIRIALKRKDYATVNNSLSMLLTYELPHGGFDVALESDFIPQIPLEATTNDILMRYKELAKPKV